MKFNELADPIQHNPTLNPKLFRGEELRSEVRDALLRIAKDFKDYVDVPFEVLDVVITGSNVNYNYTAHSDLDLHLIADFDSVDCDREAAELFDAKRLLYEKEFDIKIYDIPVGLYVEDSRTPGASSGTYSVLNNAWIKTPSKEHPNYDLKEVEHLAGIWRKIITAAERSGDLQVARTVLNLLRKFRRLGLRKPAAEFSTENLVYKILRNDQTLANLTELVDLLHGKNLSIQR